MIIIFTGKKSVDKETRGDSVNKDQTTPLGAVSSWFTLFALPLLHVTVHILSGCHNDSFLYRRPPDVSVQLRILILISQTKHVVGTQKNRLN